jgi:hypothetical protein
MNSQTPPNNSSRENEVYSSETATASYTSDTRTWPFETLQYGFGFAVWQWMINEEN